jgi:magnesium-transporting ATPase (P-type)
MPIIWYGMMDSEYDKETLLRIPELYQNGPENRSLNFRLFLSWLIYGVFQSLVIYVVSFGSLAQAIVGHAERDQNNHGSSTFSGQTPDAALLGAMILAADVFYINFRLLQDSNIITFEVIFVNIISLASLFGIFFALDSQPLSDLAHHLDFLLHFPLFGVIMLFFALSMWSINSFFYFASGSQTAKEDFLADMEENGNKKEKKRAE